MWYHSHMRRYAICLGASLVVGCGGAEPAAPATTSATGSSAAVNPAAVARVRTELPPGYEVGNLTDHAAPASFWGLPPNWTADPAHCAALADPGAGTPMRGWSASGPGGIVYALVAGPGAASPGASDECTTWTVAGGRTTAVVTAVEPPAITDTPTVAMSTVATTVVEGGTETRSHADTVTAYLDSGFVASVTVVTDPGSDVAVLGPDVAARLLAHTVSAVRG
jgi:hypothetical protein